MKRTNRRIITLALSLMLVTGVSIGLARAYFTDYETARGGAVLKLSGQTELEERMDGNDKTIVIRNTGETDMIVRVQIIGDAEKLTISAGSGWTEGSDGWWYYLGILKGSAEETERGSTSELKAAVSGEAGESDFHVIVVHEASRTVYDGSVLAVPEGWDASAVGRIEAE